MSRNYKFHNFGGMYFVSFANVFWVDVFVRRIYFDCIVKNLKFCINDKGLELYAWCIMPQKPEELLRDFKSYTSKELIKLISYHSPTNYLNCNILTFIFLPQSFSKFKLISAKR